MHETIPRPEYPRPQLVRDAWHNLNGEWEFEFDDADLGMQEGWQDGRPLSRRILVPFSYQTELSGIHDTAIHEVVWYARSFTVPESFRRSDVLLHFGAVDYRSSVWLNGREVGHNQGGEVPFSFDISPYLQEGENRLVVRVEDRQDPHQPRGKQSVSGEAREIDYYCTTGIWQTVWLEPVPKMRIEELRITPIMSEHAFEVIVYLHAPSVGWKLEIDASFNGAKVAEAKQDTANAVARLMIIIPEPKLWSPGDPNLYDLDVRLIDQGKIVDSVRSYAGMRSISVRKGGLLLNGKPLYLAMVLDQGYWPTGGLTAPTDDDLRADIEWTKRYGYNGSRKHQKVEDPRWLYWCDKLGLLVWGEMANARSWTPKAEEWLIAEWERVVRRDYNHPCIIAWVPMNESWGVPGLREDHPGQFAYLERVAAFTRRLDHFRPVIDNDGWEHTDITDICAIHDYTPTAEGLRDRYREALAGGQLPPTVWIGNSLFARGSSHHGQPVILTEVGGFLMIPQDVPEDKRDILYSFYGSCKTEEEMLEKYEDLMSGLKDLTFISGFCYTQLIDVEQEINGLMTYDRRPKVPAERLSRLHAELIQAYQQRNQA